MGTFYIIHNDEFWVGGALFHSDEFKVNWFNNNEEFQDKVWEFLNQYEGPWTTFPDVDPNGFAAMPDICKNDELARWLDKEEDTPNDNPSTGSTHRAGAQHSIREEGKMTNSPFNNKVNSVKEALEDDLHLHVNIEATNGLISLVTSGDNQLIMAGVKFANISRDLKAGEWALHVGMKFKRNKDEEKFFHSLNLLMNNAQWVDRNQDETSVDLTYIYKRDGSNRTEFETFFTTEDPTGYKRKRSLWHRSPTWGNWDHVVVLKKGQSVPSPRAANTLYIMPFSKNPDKYDGAFIINAATLEHMNGVEEDCITYDTVRVSYNHKGLPTHIKGDGLVAHFSGNAPDLFVNTANIKVGEFGFLEGVEGAIMTMNPKPQYKVAYTDPQFDSSFGEHLMWQEHPDHPGYSHYEVALQEDIGRKLTDVVLGRNQWLGFDLDSKTQTMEYRTVAERVTEEMGSILGIPSLMIKGIDLLDGNLEKSSKTPKAGKKIKARIPHARWVSMRSTALLEVTDRPVPEGNTIALSGWGFHVPDKIREAFKEATGGSDWDDSARMIVVRLTKSFTWMGYEFKKGQLLFLILRSPVGIRVHEGRVGVEYWLSAIAEDAHTEKFLRRYFDMANDGDILDLDPDKLPPCMLELPEPEVTKPTEDDPLEFMDQAVQTYQMQGLYGKVANASSLISNLASFNGFQLQASRFTLAYSAEFLIDVPTKTFGEGDMIAEESLAEEMAEVILAELKHIGVSGDAFALRTGQPQKVKVPTTNDWLFDRQIKAYQDIAEKTQELLLLFRTSYRQGWKAISPEGNLRSEALTISPLATTLINMISDAVLEHGKPNQLTTHQYYLAYTKVAEEVVDSDSLEDKHGESYSLSIPELFMLQGNRHAWSTGDVSKRGQAGTNYIGHVLFNSVMVDRTLEALSEMETDWYQDLLDTGIYDSFLDALDSDISSPMDKEIVRRFLRVAKIKLVEDWEDNLLTIIDEFGGSVSTEVVQDVEDSLSEEDENYDPMAWTLYTE